MCILFLLGGVFYNISYFKLFDNIVQVFCPYWLFCFTYNIDYQERSIELSY